MQITSYDKPSRDRMGAGENYLESGLGLLPQSHIYSLVVICHTSAYRGDEVVVLPKFDINTFLGAIQRFKINVLYLVSFSGRSGHAGLLATGN